MDSVSGRINPRHNQWAGSDREVCNFYAMEVYHRILRRSTNNREEMSALCRLPVYLWLLDAGVRLFAGSIGRKHIQRIYNS